MSVDTMARLFELKNIAGVKDATGDPNRIEQTINKLGSEFIQLTGEDAFAYEFNKRGGVGCISVTANVAPKLCSEMQKLSLSNDNEKISKAENIDKILQPLHKSLFIESNPSPVKYAAKLLNLCDDSVRLPLVTVMENTKQEVKKALKIANLLNE
jgi:4-hydroxy-tetrahydrodipicolinate synthase